MKFKNAQLTYWWYLAGATLLTTYLAGRVDGFAPSRSNLSSLTQRDELSPKFQLLSQNHACSTSLSRRMSVSVDNENAVKAEGNADEDASASSENIFTIRRTAAMVMSIAVQKIIPDAVQTGSMGPAWIDNGFYCDFATQDTHTSDDKNEENEELKSRIKEEIDSIIASAAPIVMETVSIKRRRKWPETTNCCVNNLRV